MSQKQHYKKNVSQNACLRNRGSPILRSYLLRAFFSFCCYPRLCLMDVIECFLPTATLSISEFNDAGIKRKIENVISEI